MSEALPPVDDLRSQLAECATLAELKRRLLRAAPEFHAALRRRTLIGRRADLGLRVVSLDMPYAGLAGISDSDTLVALKAHADSVIRRQTLAHECAHGLLRDVDRARLGLDREEEDRLCTVFARRALMPSERLEQYFARRGFPGTIDALRAFCKEFHVSIRSAIAELNEHGEAAGATVLLAATYRPHEKRRHEKEFRVDAAASAPDLFVARDRRLTSMGLREVCWWARRSSPGASRTGTEQHVLLRTRGTTMKALHGPASWSARVYNAATGHEVPDARSLILILDRAKLRPIPIDPTRKLAPAGAVSLNSRQTSLVK